MKKNSISIRNVLLLTVSILTLLIGLLASQQVYLEWKKLTKVESLKKSLVLSERFFDLIEELSIERDITYYALEASDADTIKSLQSDLKQKRKEVDEKIDIVFYVLNKYHLPGIKDEYKKSEELFSELKILREQVDKELVSGHNSKIAGNWFKKSTNIILQTQNLWTEFTRHFVDIDPIITQRIMFTHFLAIIMEHASRERSMIGGLIVANNKIKPNEQAQLLSWHGIVDHGWKITGLLAERSQLTPNINPYIEDAKSHYLTLYDMVKDTFYIPAKTQTSPYLISVEFWFELATQMTDSLYELKDEALKETSGYSEKLERSAEQGIALHLAIMFFTLSLCFYSFRMISNRVIKPINTMVKELLDATVINENFVPSKHLANYGEDEIGKLAYVLGAFRQNAEQIRMNSLMLAQSNKNLEQRNKELDDFAYIASHDLKEPLRAINNHSRFLLDDNKGKLDSDSVKRLHRLTHLSRRMEKLISDLLYFSRLGRQEMDGHLTDINEIIHDVANTLDMFLEENRAEIVIPKKLPSIVCDKVRVTEVFYNLITNAVKYNNNDKKTVEIGFFDEYETPDHKIIKDVFYVKDNGEGIEAKFFEEIFRIFKRLHRAESEKEGTGVGLTFIKKIIERHGGKIWLESEINKGTTFYFTLKEENYD